MEKTEQQQQKKTQINNLVVKENCKHDTYIFYAFFLLFFTSVLGCPPEILLGEPV